MMARNKERHLWSKSQFLDALTWMLGGHAAEELVFGEVTTGASTGLEEATTLARHDSYQSVADGFKQQHGEQKKQVELLKSALSRLEDKIDEAERKKDLLIARSHRAKAEQQVQGTMAGIGRVGVFDTLDRMEGKVATEEARATAATALASDDLEERFKKLEEGDDLESGKSLKEMAKARGLDEQKLSTVLESATRDELKQHVQEGHLSQAEVDKMLEHVSKMGPDHFADMMSGEMSGDMMDGGAPDTVDGEDSGCHAGGETSGHVF